MSYALLHGICIVHPERHDWDSLVLNICDVIVFAPPFHPLYVSRPSLEEVEQQYTLHDDSGTAIDDIAYDAVEVGACHNEWETDDGADAVDGT